jgi:PAS domain S-box-containing protein
VPLQPGDSAKASLPDAPAAGAAAPHAVVSIDVDGRIDGWNLAAERVFGWSADEALGRELVGLIVPPRFRRAHRAGLRRALRGAGQLRLAAEAGATASHRDGHEFPVELSVTRLIAGGRTSHMAVIRDLSDPMAAEQRWLDAEARFASLVQRLPGIAYVDEIGGATRFVSPRLREILGYAPEEWTFALWRRRLHPRDRAAALTAMAEGESSREPFVVTYRLRARDGRWVWIRDEAAVVVEAGGTLAVHGVMFDITDQSAVERELRESRREREAIAASLQRLRPGGSAEETAAAICAELPRIPHLDLAIVYAFGHDGTVVPLAIEAPGGVPIQAGVPLPPERAAYLRSSATGPWVDEWTPRPTDDDYRRRWTDLGLTCAAYVPIGSDGTVHGLLAAGTTRRIGVEVVTGWLPAMTEYAAISGALLGPELARRRERAGVVDGIRDLIRRRAYAAVFQPVVELETRAIVGYEALVRFDDGCGPERRFKEADAAGLGQVLELAVIEEAVRAAEPLPDGRWLSLNLSPRTLGSLADAGLIERLGGRPLVLELTEQVEIDDYGAVRATLGRLPAGTSLAVDDAGAGFASLRHIIELRPRYVKLDMGLVRGVDGDPARQALIAGMVYFSRQTDCVLIAEGIETEAERRTLRQLGVGFGQGFLLGRPGPAI